MTLAQGGKERFQVEGGYLEAELSLFHLYPFGQQLIVLLDRLQKLTDVVDGTLVGSPQAQHLSDLVDNPVEERHDAVDEAQLGMFLDVQTFVLEDTQVCGLLEFHELFLFLLEGCRAPLVIVIQLLELATKLATLVLSTSAPTSKEPEEKNNDGSPHDTDNDLQVAQTSALGKESCGTALQFRILAGDLEQVKVDVAVKIAGRLQVQCAIGHGKLLADARNPLRHGPHPLLLQPSAFDGQGVSVGIVGKKEGLG